MNRRAYEPTKTVNPPADWYEFAFIRTSSKKVLPNRPRRRFFPPTGVRKRTDHVCQPANRSSVPWFGRAGGDERAVADTTPPEYW